MIKSTLLASAILAAAALAAPAHAQNLPASLLDGPVAPIPPAPDADPIAKPAPQSEAAKPPVSAISSPDAVKAIDDQDTVNKLIHPDEKPDPNAVAQQMKEALDRMGQVQSLLQDKKDPGALTQENERRIMLDLDVLIDLARKQQQQQSSSSSSQQQGDKQKQDQSKQYSQGQKPGQNPGQGQGGSVAAAQDTLPNGGQATPGDLQDIHDHRTDQWGDLRPIERDLISHGANEDYVSAYRDMINRYYQALGELGKSRSH